MLMDMRITRETRQHVIVLLDQTDVDRLDRLRTGSNGVVPRSTFLRKIVREGMDRCEASMDRVAVGGCRRAARKEASKAS